MDLYRLSLGFRPYRRVLLAAGFAVTFGLVAVALAISAWHVTQSRVDSHLETQTVALGKTTSRWLGTFELLRQLEDFEACSPAYIEQMRRIGFLPDGIHELIHLDGNAIECSVTQGLVAEPIDMGVPDLTAEDGGAAFWLDRDLSILRFPGLNGTFMRIGDHAAIISEPVLLPSAPAWLRPRLTFAYADPAKEPSVADTEGWAFKGRACEQNGIYCVESFTPLSEVVGAAGYSIARGVLLSLLCGVGAMMWLRSRLDRIWSFPSRFKRLLDTRTLTCHYQPILDLGESRIGGIEVLARWQDVCGETVYPDKFLPVVEKNGLTRVFTEVLVERVYQDLLALPEQSGRLRIHFNIFPQDFDADWLMRTFARLRCLSDRFEIVAELVESDSLPLEQTRDVVETLRQYDILTYIDDFGAGYSNIQYLGYLSVAGVKLDRSFGQAPEGSLMAGLLHSAAGMISGAGFSLVVEGIETEARLRDLEKSELVDQAQGYFIAKPMAFRDLADYLDRERLNPSCTARPMLAAVG